MDIPCARRARLAISHINRKLRWRSRRHQKMIERGGSNETGISSSSSGGSPAHETAMRRVGIKYGGVKNESSRWYVAVKSARGCQKAIKDGSVKRHLHSRQALETQCKMKLQAQIPKSARAQQQPESCNLAGAPRAASAANPPNYAACWRRNQAACAA